MAKNVIQIQQIVSDYLKPVKVRIFIHNVHIAIASFASI